MNLLDADLTQIKTDVRLDVIQYLKENLRLEIDEDYDYYSGKEIIIKLILNNQKISQVYFGVKT